MKKLILLALTVAALALCGCSSTNEQGVTVNSSGLFGMCADFNSGINS